jgi:hypothetical protein
MASFLKLPNGRIINLDHIVMISDEDASFAPIETSLFLRMVNGQGRRNRAPGLQVRILCMVGLMQRHEAPGFPAPYLTSTHAADTASPSVDCA